MLQPSPLERASTPKIVGKLRGQEVIEEKDIASLVKDSQEEVGFAVSEQLDSVDVEEVVVEDLAANIEERIKKQVRLKDKIQSARGRLNPQKLQKLLKSLLEGGKQTPGDIRKALADEFADVTDQFAALQDLREQLGRGSGNDDLKQALKEASDQLFEEHGSDIIAGLNIAPVADRFAQGDVEQFQALRESYREQLKADPTLGESLAKLRERFGDDKLANQIKFLVAAAGHDLDALVSSIDKEQLGTVLGDLTRLELISSMRAQAGQIVDRVDKRFHPSTKQSDWDLLQDSVELMDDKWIAASKVQSLGDRVMPMNIEGQIYLLREMNALFRNVPTKAYDDLEMRERLLDASQEALDNVIEREEDEE